MDVRLQILLKNYLLEKIGQLQVEKKNVDPSAVLYTDLSREISKDTKYVLNMLYMDGVITVQKSLNDNLISIADVES